MSYISMKWTLLFESISEELLGKMAALDGFSVR